MTTNQPRPLFGRLRNKIFYGWVIVATCLVIDSTLFGVRYSFGVFFKSLEGEFDLTRAATSSVFSVYMIFYALFAMLSGWALDRYGARLVVGLMGLFTGLSLVITSQTTSLWQLFLSYSLLLAIGTGGTMPVLMSIVARWFERRRGFALGISTSGSGLGTLAVAPLAAYLISSLTWRLSYVVLGLIAWLVVISLAMLLRRDPGEIGALPDGVVSSAGRVQVAEKVGSYQLTGSSLSEASRTRSFWLMLAVWLLFAFSFSLILTHIVAYATDVGISTMQASMVVSIIGGLSMLSRLITGRISDIVGRKVPAVTCAVLNAGALIWLIWSHNLGTLYLFAVVFGFSWGGFGVAVLSVAGDTFVGRSLGTIMGTLEVGFALGSAMGPALGGFVFDMTGSYLLAFATAAVGMLIAGVLITLTRPQTKTPTKGKHFLLTKI